MYAKYEVNDINNSTRNTLYSYLTYITDQICHIPNTVHMENMLHGHLEPTFFADICQKNYQLSLLHHMLLQNMSEINMPIQVSIHAIHAQYFMCTSGVCMSIYVPHMKHVHEKPGPAQSCTDTMTTEGECYRLNLASEIKNYWGSF